LFEPSNFNIETIGTTETIKTAEIIEATPVHKNYSVFSIGSSSNILYKKHVLEISSWIDRQPQPYTFGDNPYELNLLLRGSVVGFSSKHFHTFCDNIPGTVIVMKILGTGEIIGGYNPLVWPSDDSFKWLSTEDSFIFTLRNQKLSTSIISRVNNVNMAIGCSSSHGPYFGNNFYKITAKKSKKWFYNDNGNYSIPIRANHESFTVVDYEVFQVLNKYNETSIN
ncbi:4004_t:CDS:1, partial [Dentiscutata heterogama]